MIEVRKKASVDEAVLIWWMEEDDRMEMTGVL